MLCDAAVPPLMPARLARILARVGLVRALVPVGLVLRRLCGDSVEVAGCSSAAAEALSALSASVSLLPAALSTVGEVRPRWT